MHVVNAKIVFNVIKIVIAYWAIDVYCEHYHIGFHYTTLSSLLSENADFSGVSVLTATSYSLVYGPHNINTAAFTACCERLWTRANIACIIQSQVMPQIQGYGTSSGAHAINAKAPPQWACVFLPACSIVSYLFVCTFNTWVYCLQLNWNTDTF